MDFLDVARYIAALLLVLGLLGGLAIVLRRGWAQGMFPALPGAQTRRRMRVVETLMLDPRRRVTIIEIDDVEHVVLLGSASETLLDTRPAPVKFEPVSPESTDPTVEDADAPGRDEPGAAA